MGGGASLPPARFACPCRPPGRFAPSIPSIHREFLSLGFKYDNLLMEESAQVLEIETFIPMLLQVRWAVRAHAAWNRRGRRHARARLFPPALRKTASPMALPPRSAKRTGSTG